MITTILDISPKSRKDSYIWEHLLKTVYALIATFGIIILVLMFIGYSKGRREPNPELMRIKKLLFEYLFIDHIEVTVAICVLFAIIFNLSAFIHNKRKIYLIKISRDDLKQSLDLKTISIYSDKSYTQTILLKDCHIKEKRIKNFLFQSHKIVQLTNLDGDELGRIDLTQELQGKFKSQIINSLIELNKIKPIKKDNSKREKPFSPLR